MAPRDHQKARTRQAILDGCAELIEQGVTPTIDDIVAHTKMSRATIYRYFKKASDIVFDVMGDRDTQANISQVDEAGDDVLSRVLAAELAVNDYLYSNPSRLHQFQVGVLQRQLEGEGLADDRKARRLQYIDRALAPLGNQLSKKDRERLRYGLALAIGAESFVSLVDVCDLDEAEARDITRWVCESLVEQALANRKSKRKL